MALEDQNKKIAAQATKSLSEEAHADIKKLRSKQDLTIATEKLYAKMGEDSLAQQTAMTNLHSQLSSSKAATANALKNAKTLFDSRTNTLVNKITQNQKSYERGMAKATADGRANIRAVRKVMVDDLEKNIARAIQLGEARQKQVLETAMANIATEKKALLTTIGEAVENMADNVFATVNSNRQKIADNYLSLKAYAATAADQVQDYLAKGKGRNLSSLGDLLKSIGALKDVKALAAKGVGFGGKTIELPFSGSVVKARWPLGLGKYLIAKLEVAMQGTGALEVDKIS